MANGNKYKVAQSEHKGEKTISISIVVVTKGQVGFSKERHPEGEQCLAEGWEEEDSGGGKRCMETWRQGKRAASPKTCKVAQYAQSPGARVLTPIKAVGVRRSEVN